MFLQELLVAGIHSDSFDVAYDTSKTRYQTKCHEYSFFMRAKRAGKNDVFSKKIFDLEKMLCKTNVCYMILRITGVLFDM